MIIDLINVPNPESIDDLLDEPLGLMYIASTLKKEEFDVRITNLAGKGYNWKDYISLDSDIYGIQLYTPTSNIGIEIAKYIRENNPTSLLVCGGAHPSTNIDSARLLQYFDIIVGGEGENEMVKIAKTFKEDNSKVYDQKFRLSTPIEHIDSLPFPDRDLVDIMKFHRKVNGKRSFGIIGSRGCPYHCSFCDRSVFGNKVRFRSVRSIFLEILNVLWLYNVDRFEFFDDLFTVSKNRLIDFRDRVKDLNIQYRCQGRTDILDPEIYKLLKESGCYSIGFGIESGNQKILDLMNKNNTVENNYKAIKIAQDFGIIVIGYFIIGFPGETVESINDTLEFIEKSNIDQAQAYQFTPFPGTEVYRNPDKFGVKILNNDWSEYWAVRGENGRGGKTIETKYLSADELENQMSNVRKFLKEYGSRGEVADYYKENLKYKERE